MNRYETGLDDEFEPRSDGRVLKNLRGIVDPREIAEVETALFATAYARSFDAIEGSTVFDTALLCGLHRDWLGTLYGFAGKLRTVDVSKDGFPFAKAEFLPVGLRDLDNLLATLTPCDAFDLTALSLAIATSHVEFEFLHPFREGNGRLGRWVADLMAVQAGRRPLRWGFDSLSRRADYFAAMRRGYLRDYDPLNALVRAALREEGIEDAPQ